MGHCQLFNLELNNLLLYHIIFQTQQIPTTIQCSQNQQKQVPWYLFEHCIVVDSQKRSITPTNSIQASQHIQSATASSVYRLTTTVLNETSKSTIGTEVTTHYSNYI